MKKLPLIFWLILMLLPTAATAQERGEISVFGGYERTWATERYPAWHGSIAGNLTKHIALVADASGRYMASSYSLPGYQSEEQSRNHTFLFGPRYLRTIKGRWTPFVHMLVGLERQTYKGWYDIGSTSNSYGPNSQNLFALAFGGGVDFKIKNRLSLRPLQFDVAGISSQVFSPCWGHYLRTSFGAVIRLK
jgi:hypothetical protein